MSEELFFATAARNLESLLADELRGLGIPDVTEARAGARFGGGLAAAYRVLLWSRVANRVLMPLARFPAGDAEALYQGVRTIEWSAHLGPEQTLAVHTETARSAVSHGRFGALKIKDAVVDQLRERTGRRPSVDPARPDIQLHCHIFRDEATLSLDLAGESLHRRGWGERRAAASLKETLAAAVLLRAGWPDIADAGGAFLDPMCGAGTLPIEACLIAADIAPGIERPYWGFAAWRGHEPAIWEQLLAEARERRAAGVVRLGRGHIRGYDRDPSAVAAGLANVGAAGLAGLVHIERRELADCRPVRDGERGLLAVNPPYGERLGADEDLVRLYARLGAVLRERFDGWNAAVLTGNPELGKRMGLRARRFHALYNGPIPCRLLHFDITAEAHVSDRPRPLAPAERGPGAEMLANRLRKNRRALAKWLRQEAISCWRLYDADLPEYALAVDIYQIDPSPGDPSPAPRPVAVVQEYAAPASIDPRDARRRLREAMAVIAEVLELPQSDLYFKIRQQQKGAGQYGRIAETGRFHEVREDGLRLLVNLDDYLDTGLFLDHRETRRLLRRQAAGRRFLNLFGYTAVASCHAAAGGARSTTTVDLSRTYCDWARRNLALNGFIGRDHSVVQADCLEWLGNARAWHGHFDLIFIDPPSFSTSKRMQGTFDVQRDHVRLVRGALPLLADGGELIFSNNLRRFRLDRDALADLTVDDITADTIPRDFARNPRIHNCWRIRSV
jgi:23S rRNA (guanine2445-N2)-methyltransferase / 23S rRNA (guanine2069-N7)-methyltransferase